MRRPPPLGEKAATGCSSGCSSPPPTSRQPTCARGARGLVMQLLVSWTLGPGWGSSLALIGIGWSLLLLVADSGRS